MDRIFLYSHGFAMHADDGGIFTDIEALFPDDKHVLFEYDNWIDDGARAIAATLSERTEILRAKYAELREQNPDAEIDLICHSQGCGIAALAQLEGITTTIFLAPPINYGDSESAHSHALAKKACEQQEDGSIIYKRSAGFETIYPPYYWDDWSVAANMPDLINQLAKKTELIIVDATNDTVIADRKDYSALDHDLRIEHLATNHEMQGEDGTRTAMKVLLKTLF